MTSTLKSLRTASALGIAATALVLTPTPASADYFEGEPTSVEQPATPPGPGNGLDELQIVLGALGGATLVAAAVGALTLRSRRHDLPHPA